jgi:MIP family channel proteins
MTPAAPTNPLIKELLPGCVAEFIGTFALVFFGVLSIVVGGQLITIALAHGLALAVFITAAAYISGGQFNPAVSIALVVAGKQSPVKAVVFIVTQLLAAACAAGLVQFILTPGVANVEPVNLGATIGSLTRTGNTTGVILVEMIMSFALMFAVIAGTVDDRAPKLGGFVIGLAVAMDIMAGGPLTGASMNPARTFGPAICGGHWDMHWVYWLAPIAGACLASVVWKVFWKR